MARRLGVAGLTEKAQQGGTGHRRSTDIKDLYYDMEFGYGLVGTIDEGDPAFPDRAAGPRERCRQQFFGQPSEVDTPMSKDPLARPPWEA